MKSNKLQLFLLSIIMLITVNLSAQEEENSTPSREKVNLVTMQGVVTEVNKESRDITLMGANGNLVTLTAGENIERFDEIEIDDVMTFEYLEYLKAEFRKPTAEEIAEPLVVVAEGGKAPEGIDPAAVMGAMVKAVVTIEVLNRPYMQATVKGPRGNYLTLPVEDETLMVKLNIGQVLILTYAEAVAISLTKVSASE